MAKYESMDHFIDHLRKLNQTQQFSDSKVDEIILSLKDGPLKSAQIQAKVGKGQIWDSLYRCIIDGFVRTEHFKATNRTYWLTEAGIGYLNFLTESDEESSETAPTLFDEDSVEDEVEPTNQSEVVRDLGATLLSEENRKHVITLQKYYQTILLGDEINRSESMFLVSVEQDHAVIQLNGSVTDRVQILEIIKQIAVQAKENTNDNT